MTNYRKLLPTVEYLHECFYYQAGKLFWRERPLHHFKSAHMCKRFNKRYSFKESGWVGDHGYKRVTINGTAYMTHRVIFKMVSGKEPEFILDHIDEDKLNNAFENLREVTRSVNRIKSSKMNNKTGFRGVYLRNDRGSYEVRVTNNTSQNLPRNIFVGYYKDVSEAAAAYNMAISILYPENKEYYENDVDFDPLKVDTDKTFFKKYGGVSSLV